MMVMGDEALAAQPRSLDMSSASPVISPELPIVPGSASHTRTQLMESAE